MKTFLWIFVLFWNACPVRGLTLALWNAHNYLIDGRWEYGKFQPYYPKPEEHKAVLRAQIKAIGADIFILLEIGSDGFLRELQEDLALEDCAYPHRICSVGEDPRQIGILSRIPIEKSFSLILKDPQSETTTKRPVLQVNFRGLPFSLIVTHLKGRRPPSKKHPGDLFNERREAEARAVASWATQEFSHAPQVLLAGDFNDGPRSRPVHTLTAAGLTWIHATDLNGKSDTYQNPRTGWSSVFDGFMGSAAFLKNYPVIRAALPSLQWSPASDHRIVLLEL